MKQALISFIISQHEITNNYSNEDALFFSWKLKIPLTYVKYCVADLDGKKTSSP